MTATKHFQILGVILVVIGLIGLLVVPLIEGIAREWCLLPAAYLVAGSGLVAKRRWALWPTMGLVGILIIFPPVGAALYFYFFWIAKRIWIRSKWNEFLKTAKMPDDI